MIKNYRPANLHPYAPERVSLWVFLEENIRLGLANLTPESPVLKWAVDEINLNDFLLTDLAASKPKVISGETLSFVMQQVKHSPALRDLRCATDRSTGSGQALGTCRVFSIFVPWS